VEECPADSGGFDHRCCSQAPCGPGVRADLDAGSSLAGNRVIVVFGGSGEQSAAILQVAALSLAELKDGPTIADSVRLTRVIWQPDASVERRILLTSLPR
jgi:hypothetical protein